MLSNLSIRKRLSLGAGPSRMGLLILGGVGGHRVRQAPRSHQYVCENMAVPKLPADKNTPGSFHRSATKRGDGRNASNTAITADRGKVRWMRGGDTE